MFYVNNQPILTPEIEVLKELKAQLALQGIDRFAKFIETTNHIQFNCPIHKDGQERKPSCGITTNKIITRVGNSEKITPAGTVHCFQCGYTASLPEMISDCFGRHNDGGLFGTQWLLKNFLTLTVEERKPLELDLNRHSSNKVKQNKPIEYVTEEELDTYRYTHPYMYQRKLTDEVIERFDIGYDDDFILKSKKTGKDYHYKCLTFPVRDINGKTLFIARRCVSNKMFHYPESVTKPIYGLYELSQVKPFPKSVYICESIIDCCTLWTHSDKYAIALNGLGTPHQFDILKKLPVREYILATDSDEAGMKARKKIKYYINNKLITEVKFPKGRKDINECTYEEIENLQIIL